MLSNFNLPTGLYMEGEVYPQPSSLTFEDFDVRDLLPIFPPPEPLELPPLPSEQRKPSFDAPYTLSTHLIPATYLRTTWPAPIPPILPANASKKDKNDVAKAFDILTANGQKRVMTGYPMVLWNCLNRYVRKGLNGSNGTGVTLFLAHGTGFPKETWEPTLTYLLRSTHLVNVVDEIWAWEAIQHGDAGIVNEPAATGIFDWSDNSRDIVNFLINFLPTIPVDTPLPTHLGRIPSQEVEAELRLKNGFKYRTLVAIGHSMGGCSSALAACVFPALFSALILVDPVIVQPEHTPTMIQRLKSDGLGRSALGRREQWSSREEALESFSSHPFFRVWDPAALKIYVECGMYDTTDSSTGLHIVRLKTSAMQEAVVFLSDSFSCRETFQRLRYLDERIPLRWIVPGKRGHEDSIGGLGDTERRVWVRPKNSANIKIREAGHLIPMEAPQRLAENIEKYLLELIPINQPRHCRSNL